MFRYLISSLALTVLLITHPIQRAVFFGQNVNTGPTCSAIAAWPMNEGSGLTLHDTIGGNTATIFGTGVTWQSNAGFPGTTPKWNVSTAATTASTTQVNFDGTTPFTISLWENGSGTGTFLSTASGGTIPGWELESAASFVTFALSNSYPSNSIAVRGNVNINSPTGLHYIVVTYDGSRTAAGTKIYTDATLNTNTVLANTLTSTSAFGQPMYVNARTDSSLTNIAAMAFVEIYPCALSQAAITANSAAGPGIY